MKRVIGILAGLVIAGIGTAILMGYVDNAKDEVLAAEELVPVYVVTEDVPRSVTIEEVTGRVALTDVPARLVAPGAVTDLALIDPAYVTEVELVTGEQLLIGRFVDPRVITRVPVPDGLQEISISLDPERALGGELDVGDTVGVYASFEEPPDYMKEVTDVIRHRVLVTNVQFKASDVDTIQENLDTGEDGVIVRAPKEQVVVTLAVDPEAAPRIVFAAEFGRLWLTSEGPDADTPDVATVDRPTIYPGGGYP